MTLAAPLVLDFDNSVLPVAETETRLRLRSWQEAIRFGTTAFGYRRLQKRLLRLMPRQYGCVFTGSGDFHHISLLLLQRLIAARQLERDSCDLLVCDNHPDNMRYLFGLHCGSWVRRAAELEAVRRIHVIGITSEDISARCAWENYLGPFLRRKLSYWSIGVHADWLRFLGRGQHSRHFASPDELLDAFLPELASARSIYLSIDKDVLSPRVVWTNWDQGCFEIRHLERIIAACADKLCGADVCGDVSLYNYKSAFKRFLSRLDGQEPGNAPSRLSGEGGLRNPDVLREAQQAQQALNKRLALLLKPASAFTGALRAL